MSGGVLNFHREGVGSPLVLVHGIGATWQCWLPVIPALAERHDVIAVDLPGFGGSVSLGVERPSLEHFSASVLALLDRLGVERFHVSGNSLGGAVTNRMLASGRVLSYSGISSVGRTFGPFMELTKVQLRGAYYGSRLVGGRADLLTRSRVFRAAALWSMLGRPWQVSPGYAAELLRGCARGSGFAPTLRHAIENGPLPLTPWDGPAQMLWGTRDRILPVSALARFVQDWPGLVPVLMDGLGHVPMQDDPALVAGHITAFTGAVDAAAPLRV